MSNAILMWVIFISIIATLIAIDLGIFHRTDREIGFRESLWMSLFYIAIALMFGVWLGYVKGVDGAAQYVTGFLVEKSLALDNIFLISMVFSSLSIPVKYQHRVLFLGILGVIVLRAIMIGLGIHIITRFGWVLYLFAAFMIITGIKMLFLPHKAVDISKNFLLIWMRKHLNLTEKLHGKKFFVSQIDPKSGKKRIFVTPLLVALVIIEFIDLTFAIDSIPAIFAITQDPYIIYTSNIFAVLGLRALYFALASLISQFYYLKYSLAVILIFIGTKIFVADFLGVAKIPPILSLGFTFIVLAAGIFFSWISNRNGQQTKFRKP